MRAPDEYGVRPRRGLVARLLVPFLVLVGAVGAVGGAIAFATSGGFGTSSPADVVARSGAPKAAASAGAERGPVGAAPSGAAGASGAVAAAVRPPAGSQVQDVLRGRGVLVYRCGGEQYTLVRTSLQLFVDHGGFAGTQAGLLTWQFKNGVRVDAALVHQVRRPATLSQALMRVVKVYGGDANDHATTFIVRLPDSGGLPPATCATTGKLLSVPFQTRYIFYRSALPGTAGSPGAAGTA